MIRSTRRLRFPAFIALALGLVAMTATHGQVKPALPGQPNPKTDDPKTESDGFEALNLPEDRDAKQRFAAVIDYLKERDAKSVPWDVVCSTAQSLLDLKSDSFYPLVEKGNDGSTKKRYLSIKDQTNKIIGTFPKEGRQFYELNYGPMATATVKEAVEAGYDRLKLGEASQRYFHTKGGGIAALMLASLNLEAGNFPEAAYGFERLIARPDSDDLLTPRTLFKAAVAFKRAGDARHTDAAAKAWEQLEKKFPRDGLVLGRKSYSLNELKAEMGRPVELLFGKLSDEFVGMRYGNPSHTGVGDGGTPFLDKQFTVEMIYAREKETSEGSDWVDQAIDLGLKQLDRAKSQVALPGFFPVTAPNLVLYRSYDGIYAVVSKDGFTAHGRTFKAGDLYWRSPTKGGLLRLMNENDTKPTVVSWWAQYWQHRMPTLVFENAQAGSMSHDGKLVYFVDDIALPPPPLVFNPNMGIMPQPMTGLGGMTEYSRMIALDMTTGKLVWDIGGPAAAPMTEEEEEKTTNTLRLTEGAIFLGPPLPLNGRLYALYERNNRIRLGCFDPYKLTVVKAEPGSKKAPEKYPELLWSQDLGTPSSKVSQDSLRRIQPAYLAYADGVLVCPTNSGAVIAVDVNARSLLWARGYNSSAVSSDPNGGMGKGPGGVVIIGGGRIRQPGMGQGPLPNDRWRASAPIISNGKVVLAAHDSDQLQCLDLRTGDLLWAEGRRKDDLYVGGVIRDKVVIVGKDSVRALVLGAGKDPGKPDVAWENLRTGTPSGHGVASKDGLFFLPMVGDADHKDSKDPQVWAIDVDKGMAKSKTAFRQKAGPGAKGAAADPRLALGNLVFHEGQMFSLTAAELTAFPLIELKKQEMDRLLAANPKDPVGLSARGDLLLDSGKIKEAVADFKEAIKHDPPETVRRNVRQKLYLAYTEMLRNDFNGGEEILSEYKTLCEIPIDAEDPVERQRQVDEQVRRMGLYLSLLAKGREKQGRLVEAFENYRQFAALGDNKQLVAIFDEPNSMTRPDVWARGRIDAMIRNATDPQVRAPLEARVKADWETVKAANDLGKLREFVKVFGPYFADGREAQLLLADKLLKTNNEDDIREAQVQLMQLWATAEDPPTAARAVEALARVMTRRGMLEDAVGLFSQLGTKYADVEVRDGKTGADIYGELITDKRLLPYLEPARGAAMSKYKVENLGAMNRGYNQFNFALQPDGDLLPFFRRYALNMEMSQDGTNSFTLRVTDKLTGEERCRFGNLASLQQMGYYNPNGNQMGNYRVALASGHLLLLNLGQYAYCFDLAEKRELWKYNLFGNNPVPMENPPQIAPDKDELVISYPDGWQLRLGRSAVLQPTYACLLTRDGLIARDPQTGQVLWQRANVSTKAQVFGDARHVFLVETTSAGSSAKVLRAVDGSVVDGIKDFAGIYSSPGRIAVLGRNILVADTAEPPSLRLYDPIAGKDLWKKTFAPGGVAVKTIDPNLTGFVNPDGSFQALDAHTGKSLFVGGVDGDRAEAHLKDSNGKFAIKQPLLIADAERFYLFLNKTPDPNQPRFFNGQQSSLRTVDVNGAAYGFDRTTGKRLWFYDSLFENQKLILDRFDELPCLVAANTVMDPATRQQTYKVVALDKNVKGIQYLRGHNFQNGQFLSMFADRKGAFELWRYDFRVRIAPDEEAAKP